MKKKILLICRSDGCLERISAFVFFFHKKYSLTIIVDSTYEKICNIKLLKFIKKFNIRIIYFSEIFLVSFFGNYLNTYFGINPTLFFYSKKIKKIINSINPDLCISDLNSISENDYIRPNNITMLIRKILNKDKIVCFKTGALLNNNINFYKKKLFIDISNLIVSTKVEKTFFEKFLTNGKVSHLSELCYDKKFLTALKNYFSIKVNSNDILYLFSNLTEIDTKLSITEEYNLNIILIKKLLGYCKKNNKKIFLKEHPRIKDKKFRYKVLKNFNKSDQSFIRFINQETSALELLFKFKHFACLFTSTLFQAIVLKKKVIVSDYLKNLNSIIYKKSKYLNYISLNKDCILKTKFKSSNKNDALFNFVLKHKSYNIYKGYNNFLNSKLS